MTPEMQAQIIQRQAAQIGEISFQNVVLSSQVQLLTDELDALKKPDQNAEPSAAGLETE